MDANDAFGVRPAFKLNPQSVIFTSEILSNVTGKPYATAADSNYAARAAGANFKLTVVNSSLSSGTLTIGTDAVSGALTNTVAPDDTITVNAAGATGGTYLTCKIVGNNGGQREIVGYGQASGNTSLTVKAKDLDGVDLPDGDYTVYIWAQKNNAINSHEGSAPLYFNLTVDGTAPTVTAVGTATRTDAANATATKRGSIILKPSRRAAPTPT